MRETDELLPTTTARIVDTPRARPGALALTLAVALCAASAIAEISGLRVAKGAWEAQVVDALAPLQDEIVLPKGSSSVFVSTNITYVLRNLSLWRGDDPATGGDEEGLSTTARHFIAGVLAHARGLEALAAPTPGCYARHGNWAPTRADWGHDDRTVCIRVKSRDCAPGDAYIEYTRGVVAFTPASGVGTPSTRLMHCDAGTARRPRQLTRTCVWPVSRRPAPTGSRGDSCSH